MTNVALIGLKGHQSTCLDEIVRREEVRLAAVWDDDGGALNRFKSHPAVDPQTLVTPNLDELLAHRDVQIVVLAEDNASRAEHLLAAAQRGWQIVAEKPLTIQLADLDRVRTAITAAGVRLSMLLTMRFEGPYQAIRREVTAGAIGRPLLLSGQKSYKRGQRPAWMQQPATFGGTIPYIGIHPLDLLQWTSGERFVRVAAQQRNSGLPGAGQMEETATLLLQTANGALADVRLDYLRPGSAASHGDDRLRLAGERGVIETIGGKVTLLPAQGEPRELPANATGSLFGSFLDELAGRGEHPISAADCYQLTDVVLRAREAAERAVWMEIPR
ncbi:MAG: Gfo/Idh/MocA family oxidoreductase [Fimbriimonadaceae bacterium]|nr:Gfo/Idh/MocA family oxidoreductase [Fimbriimonadaceae bacterium]